jgi:hypothetical protein
MTNIIDRREGVSEGLAAKAPVRVATTANITLSGLQTIDGVVLVADDRVLVWQQTEQTENGIYIAGTGTWERAKDFDSQRDISKGTHVFVNEGTLYASLEFFVTSEDPHVVDTDEITFSLGDIGTIDALTGTGILVRTAALTWALRTLAAPAAGLTITNPAGIAGNPTFALANDLAGLEGLLGAGLAVRTTTDTWANRSLVAPAAGLTIANPAGVAGDLTFALADDLAGIEAITGTGLVSRTASNTFASRTLTAPAAGITVSNGDGVAGNPTLALADDLAALEALSGTDTIYRRSGVSTWAAVTFAGGIAFALGVLSLDIHGTTAVTSPAVDDELIAYDLSAGANRRIAFSDFLKVVNGLTEDTSPDGAADFLLSYDASAGAAKKVLPNSLPISTATQAALDLKVPLSYLDADTALTANSDTKVATQKATKAYVDALALIVSGALIFKGAFDASAGSFPGTVGRKTGWFYRVSVAGTVDGVSFTVGDDLYAIVDNASTTTYAANWLKIEGALTSAEIIAALSANSIALSKIAQGTALSVLGVAGNATANYADIVAGSDDHVLRRSGTSIGFGTIVAGGIASDAITTAKILNANVTYAKIQNVAALSVFGRSANSSGVGADITGADGNVLRVSGTTLGFGTVATAGIADDAITYAKIQNISATSRVLGRKTAGAGDTEELTLSEVLDLIGSAAQGDILYRGSSAWARLGAGTADHVLKTKGAAANPAFEGAPEVIVITCSDETTALTTGTNKVKFRMPYAFTLTAIRGSLSTAQATNGAGGIFTVDVNEAGTTILSTKLTIDNTELTSTTAATAAVISDSALADDAEMSVDIDQIGDGTAKGLKVYLIGRRT